MMANATRWRAEIWVALGLGFLTPVGLEAQGWADDFSDGGALDGGTGTLEGSIVGAGMESHEPRHGENAGGHSVWVSWTAPENGLLTLTADSDEFDTLLAVYWREHSEDPPMEGLKRVAKDDDSGPDGASQVQFWVESGRRYEIAVDGYGWRQGAFRLDWAFLSSTSPLPIITGYSSDVALRLDEPLTLMVDLQQLGGDVRFRWYRNYRELEEEDGPSLTLPAVKESDLGRYRLRVSLDELRLWSEPIEVQVNSEGLVTVLARDKVLDALSSGLDQPPPPGPIQPLGPTPGVVRGYQGTQIFNTAVGGRDPLEPSSCGADQGPTYWFAYQAPDHGVLTLDTAGSAFDTVLSVYTFDAPLSSFDDLRLVVCDDNGGTDQRSSWVRCAAEASRTYCVVVAGAAGDSGLAHLNYSLDTNAPTAPTPPVLGEPPASRTVPPGASVTFETQAAGAGPLQVQWLKNGDPVSGATNSALSLSSVGFGDVGAYAATVTNPYGTATSAVARLEVLVPPKFQYQLDSGLLTLTVQSAPGLRYSLESNTRLGDTNWNALAPPILAEGTELVFSNVSLPSPSGFYRLRAY